MLSRIRRGDDCPSCSPAAGVRDQVIETGDELERVLTFIVKGSRGPITFYTHTKADADVGYWFISYADAVPLAPVTLVEDPRSA